ncbi:hypothetical protein A0H81_10332 [Grifola frondosa]|uniref:Uncharacterized protein n=1 Tax=Grifola frondosa TaxID=5627 RepID=A0A1C7M3K4_GRIFR|nr:hypothetical protein A0H81_10332 [Grifola frondosa]
MTYFSLSDECFVTETIMTDTQISVVVDTLAKNHADDTEFLAVVDEAVTAFKLHTPRVGHLFVQADSGFNKNVAVDASGYFKGKTVPNSTVGGTFKMYCTPTTVKLELYQGGSSTPWHTYIGKGRQDGIPAEVKGDWS